MKSKQRRQDILEAAIRVFAERGYYTANVSDVAHAAGVAQGTIYLYFKSKEELLRAIFNEKMGELIDFIDEQICAVKGAEARLARLIEVQIEHIEIYPELTELILVELRQSGKFLHEDTIRQIQRYLGIIEDLLREGIEEGIYSEQLPISIAATMLYSGMEGLATRWSLEDTKQPLKETAAAVKEIFLEGIRR